MSSRETFVTNYLYSDDAVDALMKVLKPVSHWISDNHRMFISGVIKNGWYDYGDILARCKEALEEAGCGQFTIDRFQLVLCGDDVPGVLTPENWWGTGVRS